VVGDAPLPPACLDEPGGPGEVRSRLDGGDCPLMMHVFMNVMPASAPMRTNPKRPLAPRSRLGILASAHSHSRSRAGEGP